MLLSLFFMINCCKVWINATTSNEQTGRRIDYRTITYDELLNCQFTESVGFQYILAVLDLYMHYPMAIICRQTASMHCAPSTIFVFLSWRLDLESYGYLVVWSSFPVLQLSFWVEDREKDRHQLRNFLK